MGHPTKKNPLIYVPSPVKKPQVLLVNVFKMGCSPTCVFFVLSCAAMEICSSLVDGSRYVLISQLLLQSCSSFPFTAPVGDLHSSHSLVVSFKWNQSTWGVWSLWGEFTGAPSLCWEDGVLWSDWSQTLSSSQTFFSSSSFLLSQRKSCVYYEWCKMSVDVSEKVTFIIHTHKWQN